MKWHQELAQRGGLGLVVLLMASAVSCDHWADLSSVSVSFQRNQVAAICGHYNICVWDLRTGKLNRRISLENKQFSAIAFSPNGRILAAGHPDASISLLDPGTGAKVRKIEVPAKYTWVFTIVFSPDGSKLAAAGQGWPLRIWDVNTGAVEKELQPAPSTATFALAFSPDGTTIASGSDDGLIRLFSVDSGKLRSTLQPHRGMIRAVAFSADGRLLASGSEGSSVDVWDLNSGARLSELQTGSVVPTALAFSQDSSVVLSAGADRVRVWRWSQGSQLMSLQGGGVGLLDSPDGKYLISGGTDSVVRLWDVQTGREIRHFSCYRAVWPWT